MNIRSSFILSYAQKYTSITLQFVSMVVVARLMAPSEVGVFAAGAAFVALGSAVAELGQDDYLIQKSDVTSAHVRTAFGVAWLSSWLCALVIGSGAVLFVPDSESQLRSVVIVLAAAMAMRPFSLIMRATLLRNLRFDRLYLVNLSRDTALVGGSIVLVYLGYSAVGLALGLLLEQLALIVWAAAHHLRFGWARPSLEHVRELLHFGYLRAGVAGLAELGTAASRLVIGGMLGYGALGLINRAQKITRIFDNTITDAMLPVLLPYLSDRIRRGDSINEVMERKVAILSGIAWPFFAFLAIAAEPIVLVLLGQRWVEAVPVIQVLCLAGLALPFGAGVFSFLVAHGLLRAYLPIQVLIQLVVVGAAALGSLVSVELACLAFVAGQVLKAATAVRLLRRRAELETSRFLPSLRASALLTLLTVLPAFAALQLPLETAAARGAAAALGVALVWLAGVFVTNHPLGAELQRLVRLGVANRAQLPGAWSR